MPNVRKYCKILLTQFVLIDKQCINQTHQINRKVSPAPDDTRSRKTKRNKKKGLNFP